MGTRFGTSFEMIPTMTRLIYTLEPQTSVAGIVIIFLNVYVGLSHDVKHKSPGDLVVRAGGGGQ